jgi:hypothetical protein
MKKEKFGLIEFLLNFLIGAALGAPNGFLIWANFVKHSFLDRSNSGNSYLCACLFIGGGAFLGGLLFALYKGHRGYW